MALRQTVTVSGLRELDKALGELKKSTGKNVLRRVLRKRAEPMADDMRARAPDDPVSPAGRGDDLRTSIGVGTKLTKRQRSLHRKMFRDDKASVEVFVGAGNVPHAHMQEFGVAHHGPQPFARPAWDAGKTRLLDGIGDDLWAEVEKSAKRAARKQVKQTRKRLGLE